MKLEKQLETLSRFGLTLNEGVTVDDLLYSFDRAAYEDEPFDLILFMLGSEVEREPWGRDVCSRAWNLDMECITQTGDYVKIVKRLREVAGLSDVITDVEDYVNLETGEAWLRYSVGGNAKQLKVAVNDDWADPDAVAAIMGDIERDGKRFYGKDNGQATIWFYLEPSMASELNKLTNNALIPGP